MREPLWAEPMSILARADHPIFSGPGVDAEHLRRHEWVLPTLAQRMGQEIEQLLERLGVESRAAYRSNSAGFIREMLHGGDLLSIMPRLMMVGDLVRGALRFAPLPIDAPERPAGLIRRRGAPPLPVESVFVETLRAYVDDLTRRGLAPPI
jgi:LysR family transcriptional regulator, pca operon transcriptional activator